MMARWLSRITLGLGLLLIAAATWQLLPQRPASDDVWTNAVYPENTTSAASAREPNLLGWGTLLLGFLTLASSHYFKLREARRADRVEARDIHKQRRNNDDVA